MKTKLCILTMLAVFTITGCKKKDDDNVGPLYIPQALKDYSYFLPGTYWVYIDSVSGRVDSLVVYETTHGFDTIHYNNSPISVFEIYVVKAHSYMDGYDYYVEVNTTYSVNDPEVFDVFHEKLKPGNYIGRSFMFIYKPYKGQIIHDLNATKYVNDVFPSLTLNGVIYNNVIDISYDHSPVDVSQNVRKFIASKYGIVRKEYADSNQVWVLARSNIIQ